MLHALRLIPGDDLKESLDRAVAQAIDAAAVVTCVGSLEQAMIRFAGAEQATRVPGPLEIVSLVGTLCRTTPTGRPPSPDGCQSLISQAPYSSINVTIWSSGARRVRKRLARCTGSS